jgi:hypothetical protein
VPLAVCLLHDVKRLLYICSAGIADCWTWSFLFVSSPLFQNIDTCWVLQSRCKSLQWKGFKVLQGPCGEPCWQRKLMSIYRKLAVLVQDKMLLPARACSKSDVCLGVIVHWMYRRPHWLNDFRFKSEGGSCNSKRVNLDHQLLEFYQVMQIGFHFTR